MPDPGRRTFPLEVFGSKVPTAPCGVGRILNIAWRPHRTHQGLSLGCHLPSPQPPTQREVQSLPRSRPQAETAARCTEGTRMPPPPPHQEGGRTHRHRPPGARQLPCHRPAGLLVRRNTRTQQSRAPQTVPASLAARTVQGLGRLTSCFPSSCCLPLQAGLSRRLLPGPRLPFLWLTSSLPTPCAGNAAGLVSCLFLSLPPFLITPNVTPSRTAREPCREPPQDLANSHVWNSNQRHSAKDQPPRQFRWHCVHTHGPHTPRLGGFFSLFLFFFPPWAFSCYIHICIYILFVSLSSVSWQMYRFFC